MALGQAAGVAASIAIEKNTPLKKVDIREIQDALVEGNSTLIYFKDITMGHPDFAMLQYMGLRGYIPEWEANLNALVDATTCKKWSELFGIKINPGEKKRGDVLRGIYEIIR